MSPRDMKKIRRPPMSIIEDSNSTESVLPSSLRGAAVPTSILSIQVLDGNPRDDLLSRSSNQQVQHRKHNSTVQQQLMKRRTRQDQDRARQENNSVPPPTLPDLPAVKIIRMPKPTKLKNCTKMHLTPELFDLSNYSNIPSAIA